jgi:predicted nuclease of predicted toxin-antitoxin system
VNGKKLLLDENLPHKTRDLLAEYEIFTVAYLGWTGTRNGDLLDAAERGGFDVLITSDQGFPHQQSLHGRHISVVLLPTPDWNVIKGQKGAISIAIERSSPGTLVRAVFEAS